MFATVRPCSAPPPPTACPHPSNQQPGRHIHQAAFWNPNSHPEPVGESGTRFSPLPSASLASSLTTIILKDVCQPRVCPPCPLSVVYQALGVYGTAHPCCQSAPQDAGDFVSDYSSLLLATVSGEGTIIHPFLLGLSLKRQIHGHGFQTKVRTQMAQV